MGQANGFAGLRWKAVCIGLTRRSVFYYQVCAVVVEQAWPSATMLTGNIFRFLFGGCL
jgi:hypothetical protein